MEADTTRRPGLPVPRNRLIHRGLLIEYFSLGWMAVEGFVAISSGLLAGSLALLAFGGDSVIELISSYAVAAYLRKLDAGIGHDEALRERTERVTSFLLIALIPAIAIGAAYGYLTGIEPEASLFGIALALGAVVIMPVIWLEKRRIGKEASCLPLTIDAIESAACFFMALALLAGLLLNYLLHVPWVDYLATAAILAFVTKEAIESVNERKMDWHSSA